MPTDRISAVLSAWRSAILRFVADHPDRPLKLRALARALAVPNEDYTTFRSAVRELIAAGDLMLGAGRTLRLPVQARVIVGTFHAHQRGFGFVETPGHPDLYVHPRRTAGARDGDVVAVRLLRPHPAAPGPTAEVVQIIERAPVLWVGTVEATARGALVRPEGRQTLPPVHLLEFERSGARVGQLVVVQPVERTLGTRNPLGHVIEVLGDPADGRARVLGIVRRFGLPDAFPTDVLDAARQAAEAFDPADGGGRRDLRDLLTITIDPPDARDFDDAISVEDLSHEHVRLGVHIADVAHFVPADGPVDAEARRRGTSVYFPGRVVPMLPPALSNGVCSLQPGEPRFTRSVLITYDRQGRPKGAEFAVGIIQSAARLTYEQAAAVLAGKPQGLAPPLRALLKRAATLARRIQQRRLKDGMISLALPEVEIRLDEAGRVASAGPAEASFAHTLIEMFMVEANEAVSGALTRTGVPHLRRVHPAPDADAVGSLACLAPALGHAPPRTLDRESINRLLNDARDTPAQAAVHFTLLRALPQACYSPDGTGHFALASREYCHFTSPIRRYPDLTVHRLFDVLLDGSRRIKVSERELGELGRWCSSAERRALQAEREAQAALLTAFMRERVGEVCAGVITGVTSLGAYVQLHQYLAEGLVPAGDFGPDEWRYERRAMCFWGRRTGTHIHLGQSVRVKVAGVDTLRSQVLLVPADGLLGTPAAGTKARPTGHKRRQRR